MSSEWVRVGSRDGVLVHRHKRTGEVSITLLARHESLYMTAGEGAAAAELLDRAAMPGQGRADGEAPAAEAREHG